MSLASDLTTAIIDFLYRQKVYAWRVSSSGIFDEKINRFRPAAKKGVADILAVMPPDGRLLAIEVKIGKDRLSPEQTGFLKNLEHVGALTYIAKDFDSFKTWYESLLERSL